MFFIGYNGKYLITKYNIGENVLQSLFLHWDKSEFLHGILCVRWMVHAPSLKSWPRFLKCSYRLCKESVTSMLNWITPDLYSDCDKCSHICVVSWPGHSYMPGGDDGKRSQSDRWSMSTIITTYTVYCNDTTTSELYYIIVSAFHIKLSDRQAWIC